MKNNLFNKTAALQYVKENYPGFENNHYEMAVAIGDEANFGDTQRQLINVQYYPYISRDGETYHQLFLKRVDEYFKNHKRIKTILNKTYEK